MHPFEDIKLKTVPVGRDMLLIITGGEAHIGAASTAYVSGEGAVLEQTSSVPGHKEYTLTGGLAVRAAESLQRTVTVVMGIHYDGLDKEQILEITKRTEALLDDYLLRIERGNHDE